MAGTNTDFNKAEFRRGILLAMNMGAPGAPDQRLTFVWEELKTFATADDAGDPFDWTAAPATDTTIAELQVAVAVTRGAVGTTETEVGQFDDTRITITVLAEEWAEVLAHASNRLPERVRFNGDLFVIESGPQVIALFDEDVITLIAVRADAL